MVSVQSILFSGKQNIPWKKVEKYLKPYISKKYIIHETQDVICIGGSFPEEFAWSKYTRKLRGGYAKVKANLVTVIEDLIRNASNKRWVENKEEKHAADAKYGWYRYDIKFAVLVKAENELKSRFNYYQATLIVKSNDNGLYLYDIINIKKEACKPREL